MTPASFPLPPDPALDRFEAWWEAHGQHGRAGGGNYEKTFAFNAWQAVRGEGPEGPGLTAPELERRLAQAATEADFQAIPLKACPFCGPGRSVPGLYFDDVAQRYRVGCGCCGCATGTHPHDRSPTPAIRAWCTRA